MILIKCADISNECRPMEVAEPWIDCLLQEFFNQVCDMITFNPYRVFLWQFTAMWSHAEAMVLMKWADFRWVVATLITLKIMSLCSVAVMESGCCSCYVSRVEPAVTKYNLDFHCFKRVLFPVLFSRVAKNPCYWSMLGKIAHCSVWCIPRAICSVLYHDAGVLRIESEWISTHCFPCRVIWKRKKDYRCLLSWIGIKWTKIVRKSTSSSLSFCHFLTL